GRRGIRDRRVREPRGLPLRFVGVRPLCGVLFGGARGRRPGRRRLRRVAPCGSLVERVDFDLVFGALGHDAYDERWRAPGRYRVWATRRRLRGGAISGSAVATLDVRVPRRRLLELFRPDGDERLCRVPVAPDPRGRRTRYSYRNGSFRRFAPRTARGWGPC